MPNRSRLPIDGLSVDRLNNHGIVVVQSPSADNELFCDVELPDSWSVRQIEHLWSELLDEVGRKKASIFYKPDWYDSYAFINFRGRNNGLFDACIADEKSS